MLGVFASIYREESEVDRKESEYACPLCETKLVEKWGMVDDGSLAHNKEYQRVGKPYCPKGHRITEWNLAGQPMHAV